MGDDATARANPADSRDSAIALVGGIFDVATTAPAWSAFIDRLADVLREHGILLMLQKVSPEVLRAHDTFEPAQDGQQERIRLRIELSRSVAADGLQVTSEDGQVDPWKLVKGVGIETTSLPLSATFVLGCFVSRREATAYLMGVRWHDASTGDELSRGLLRDLVPQLQRAIMLHKQFNQLRTQHHAASDVLNWLPFAVLFVDPDAHVLTKNRKAAAMAAERDGLLIERSVLAAPSSRETARLRELIRQAASPTGRMVAEAMTVTRPSMRRPLTVMVSALPSAETADMGAAPTAVVFISDPEENYNIAEETVLHFFDLTPAEARLLVALANGGSLGEIAQRHAVTLNTLKTQLNQIFRKTGTNRQSDLIKLVFSTPVVMNAVASESPPANPATESAG